MRHPTATPSDDSAHRLTRLRMFCERRVRHLLLNLELARLLFRIFRDGFVNVGSHDVRFVAACPSDIRRTAVVQCEPSPRGVNAITYPFALDACSSPTMSFPMVEADTSPFQNLAARRTRTSLSRTTMAKC